MREGVGQEGWAGLGCRIHICGGPDRREQGGVCDAEEVDCVGQKGDAPLSERMQFFFFTRAWQDSASGLDAFICI